MRKPLPFDEWEDQLSDDAFSEAEERITEEYYEQGANYDSDLGDCIESRMEDVLKDIHADYVESFEEAKIDAVI